MSQQQTPASVSLRENSGTISIGNSGHITINNTYIIIPSLPISDPVTSSDESDFYSDSSSMCAQYGDEERDEELDGDSDADADTDGSNSAAENSDASASRKRKHHELKREHFPIGTAASITATPPKKSKKRKRVSNEIEDANPQPRKKRKDADQAERLQMLETQNTDDNKDDGADNEEAIKLKFESWLCETVKLGRYLAKFQENECDDVRMIEFLDEETLRNDLDIGNRIHRKLILKKVVDFKRMQAKFNSVLDGDKRLEQYKELLEENGILTMKQFQSEIQTKEQLARMLGIVDGNKANAIWAAFFPNDEPNAVARSSRTSSSSASCALCAIFLGRNAHALIRFYASRASSALSFFNKSTLSI